MTVKLQKQMLERERDSEREGERERERERARERDREGGRERETVEHFWPFRFRLQTFIVIAMLGCMSCGKQLK